MAHTASQLDGKSEFRKDGDLDAPVQRMRQECGTSSNSFDLKADFELFEPLAAAEPMRREDDFRFVRTAMPCLDVVHILPFQESRWFRISTPTTTCPQPIACRRTGSRLRSLKLQSGRSRCSEHVRASPGDRSGFGKPDPPSLPSRAR
ncbi:hypothetical protein MJT46_004318 [Ovis ammon polii x Ovis aries]|nr:hypothetical protein MJT46_004318 [Ovis ammon polii x Ovis aries]